MKRWWFGLLALLCLTGPAHAAPACFPTMTPPTFVDSNGTPKLGEVVYAASTVGVVWGYTCKDSAGKWWAAIGYGTWDQFPRDWLSILDAGIRGTDADRRALWDKYAVATTIDERLVADWNKIAALLPRPPAAPAPGTFVVAPTTICPAADKSGGVCIRRSSYAWDNATKVRTTTAAAEKVDIGSACDPAVGAAGFYGVLGRTDRVAPCVKR